MCEISNYYDLQKNSKEKYEKFLKKLSSQTISKKFFTSKNGSLEKKRKELHDKIINDYLVEHSSQTQPRIYFILGSIGSGKTSLKDTIIKDFKTDHFLYINFDDLKLKLPEYEILKKLNPQKAAHFVQSESARLAGTLYRKVVKNKINIIYEKNIRLNKDGKLHIISEIKSVLRKGYNLSIHVVFLDSCQEAWRRVQSRYEEIRRYVPMTEVRETFNDLFPHLNILLNENFNADYSVNLWYNGLWNTSSMEKKAHNIGFISFQNKRVLNSPFKEEDFAILFESSNANNSPYLGGLFRHTASLPKAVKHNLKSLDCLKKPIDFFEKTI